MDDDSRLVTDIQVRCLNPQCKKWFHSPMWFKRFSNFETSALSNNRAECPHCHEVTPYNKENVKIQFEGGGFFGDDAF